MVCSQTVQNKGHKCEEGSSPKAGNSGKNALNSPSGNGFPQKTKKWTWYDPGLELGHQPC